MRGQSRDYDQWAQLTGDDTWRWDNVLPAFMRHEDHYLGDKAHTAATSKDPDFPAFHGVGGEWRVEQQRLRWDILDAFADAAEQATREAAAEESVDAQPAMRLPPPPSLELYLLLGRPLAPDTSFRARA